MPDDVQFDIDTVSQPRTNKMEDAKLARWIIRHSWGIIRSEEQANYLMLGFVIVALTVSFFGIFGGSSPYDKHVGPFVPIAGPNDPNFKQ